MSNSVATLTGLNAATFLENTVNATPQLLDADVSFTDLDGNFTGGTMTVSGLLTEDTVSIRHQGTGGGQIGFSGGLVTYEGTLIGVAGGGAGGTLIVALLDGATSAAVDALIQNLTYSTSSNTPTASHTLEIKVTDAAGAAAIAPVTFAAGTGAPNLNAGGFSAPTFADLDGDGDLDAVVGVDDGILNYFDNTGSTTAPAFVARTGAANPFNGVNVGGFSTPTFADLDGDGDLDAVIGESGGFLHYFENTGTATAAAFVEQTGAANPFNGVDVGLISAPTFADLDGDGDLDAIVGAENGILNYFENTGTAIAPVFVQQTGAANPFNGVDVGLISTPSVADLDGDGDLDAVVGEDNGTLKYFENTGTATAPIFLQRTGAANPFNSLDVGFDSTPSFVDLNGDGNLDVIVGEFDGDLNYYENTTPGAIAPDFIAVTGAANPFNSLDVGFDSTPSFADLDGDGDLDLLVGENLGNVNYFKNTGTAIAPVFAAQTGTANPFDGVDVGSFSKPSFVDLDGDGDLDVVVGETSANLNYYENTGSAAGPVFVLRTDAADPFDGINPGLRAAPSFADLDGDGDLDLTVGESDGSLNYFENTGTAIAPVFVAQTGAADPFNGIDVGSESTPSFADLDGDGDLDAIVGEFDGNLNYFENTGTAIAPVFVQRTGAGNPFDGIDVGNGSAPNFADLDGDGDPDLTVGENDGTLNYFRNTGSGFELIVNLTAENDAPAITSGATGSEAENSAISNVVYQTTATDPDTATLIYSLAGVDAALFDISATGAVTFKVSPNFEAPGDQGGNNVYDIVVNVSDGVAPVVTKAVAITVNDVNDVAPQITSGGTGTEAENTAINNVVYQATATDPDTTTLIYSLSGADAALFDISSSGAVTFKVSPNFEAPGDQGGNNLYDIVVNVSDGMAPVVTKGVAITVTDVNDVPPQITSGGTGTEAENTAVSNVVYQTSVTDPDTTGTRFYSLTGADAGVFDISALGALTFKAAPNFENPLDAGGNNVYEIVVNVNDGVNAVDSKAVAITVTAVNETPTSHDHNYTLDKDEPLTVAAPGLLDDASDPESDALTAHSVSGPGHGTVSLNADGSLTYKADLTFFGEDSFTFIANDGSLNSNVSTVKIDVTREISSETTTNPAGGSTTTYYDAKGDKPWSSQNHNFDSNGHETSTTVSYDNGTLQGATFDANNDQPWSSQNSVANAQGQVTNMGVIYDDGTQQVAIFDAAGDQAWKSQNMVYDAHGHLTIVGVIYDDGHTETAVFDAHGDQPWTSQSAVYDPNGKLIATSVTYDGYVTDWHI